jgi:hypothetical protein
MLQGKIGAFRKAPYSEVVVCPRCNKNNLPIGYPGALSRVDNETEICSPCGTDEGMRDWLDRFIPGTEQWPVPIKFELSTPE